MRYINSRFTLLYVPSLTLLGQQFSATPPGAFLAVSVVAAAPNINVAGQVMYSAVTSIVAASWVGE